MPKVLCDSHNGTSDVHFRMLITLEKVRERFYWSHSKVDVMDWCRKCIKCVTSSASQKRPRALIRQNNVGSPFKRIVVGVASPFPVRSDIND